MGPLEKTTQEKGPPDWAPKQDPETRPTTEPTKKPPYESTTKLKSLKSKPTDCNPELVLSQHRWRTEDGAPVIGANEQPHAK